MRTAPALKNGGSKRSAGHNAGHNAAQCGCETGPRRRKPAGVDPQIKAANLQRLRRIEGQVRGLQKMVAEDRYCPDIMIQISAAHEALRTVGRGLMQNHLRHCVTQAVSRGPARQATAVYNELMELIYKHSR